ncbi:MAG: glycosyltransferase family 2 protein [Anaerolineaceae bacterium]|nr:glycosyltransferase family 2 protein [Anaerolineaceae bacterium]
MTGMIDVSVIVCAYTEDRWNDLVAAVDSLQKQSVPPGEIIVVVDHNPALLARVCGELGGITGIENQEQRGLSGARNSGIRVARGSVLAFMDEDAVAASDWIERLQSGYQQPEVVGVGGAILPHWLSARPAWFPVEFDWVVGCTYRGMPEDATPVRNLIGCNMSFRREVFEAVGGFRVGMGRVGTLPVGCEETELCIRSHQRLHPGILLYEPTARVHHRVPAHRANLRYFLSRCYSEGISKSQVAHWVGAGDGLANERTYTLRTLPEGFLDGLKAALFHGQLAGLGRAAAITSGLLVTTAGYLAGGLMEKLGKRQPGDAQAAQFTRSG